MKQIPSRILLLSILLVLCFVFKSIAQLNLGGMTMSVMEAAPLKSPLNMSRGSIYSQKSLASVGGIAFELEAVPVESLKVDFLSFLYSPEQEDGSRLLLSVNDKEIYTKLYDWQLIPIAHYAQSPYYACFTYFGHLIAVHGI